MNFRGETASRKETIPKMYKLLGYNLVIIQFFMIKQHITK